MLLTGRHPLYEGKETREEIKAKILASEWHYPKDFGSKAKDLFLRLVKPIPSQRYNASQALCHPWIIQKEGVIPLTYNELHRLFWTEKSLKAGFQTLFLLEFLRKTSHTATFRPFKPDLQLSTQALPNHYLGKIGKKAVGYSGSPSRVSPCNLEATPSKISSPSRSVFESSVEANSQSPTRRNYSISLLRENTTPQSPDSVQHHSTRPNMRNSMSFTKSKSIIDQTPSPGLREGFLQNKPAPLSFPNVSKSTCFKAAPAPTKPFFQENKTERKGHSLPPIKAKNSNSSPSFTEFLGSGLTQREKQTTSFKTLYSSVHIAKSAQNLKARKTGFCF